jgi:hypothetical protein
MMITSIHTLKSPVFSRHSPHVQEQQFPGTALSHFVGEMQNARNIPFSVEGDRAFGGRSLFKAKQCNAGAVPQH